MRKNKNVKSFMEQHEPFVQKCSPLDRVSGQFSRFSVKSLIEHTSLKQTSILIGISVS